MTGCHVPDLVAEHAGELRLVAQERQDPAGDVDVSARKRERVDRRLIDDGEVPRQVGPFGRARQPHRDVFDVALQLGIVVDPHFLPHLTVHLLTELDLLRFAHQREFPFTGCRIRGARDHRTDGDGSGGGFSQGEHRALPCYACCSHTARTRSSSERICSIASGPAGVRGNRGGPAT